MAVTHRAYPSADAPLRVVPSVSVDDDEAGYEVPLAGAGTLPSAPADQLPVVPRRRRTARTRVAPAVEPLAGADARQPAAGRTARRRSRGVSQAAGPESVAAPVVDPASRPGEPSVPPGARGELAERARQAGLPPDDYLALLLAGGLSTPPPGPTGVLLDDVEPSGPVLEPEFPDAHRSVPPERAVVLRRVRPDDPVAAAAAPWSSRVSGAGILAVILAGFLTVVLSVLTFVAAGQYFPRYEVMTLPGAEGVSEFYRVDRWTGQVSYCGVRTAAGVPPASACVAVDLAGDSGPGAPVTVAVPSSPTALPAVPPGG